MENPTEKLSPTEDRSSALAVATGSAPLHPDCQINVEPFFQCCCTCKYRVAADRRWPWWIVRTLQILRLPRLPLFMPGKQWACVAYDLSHVESHWPEHSCGCEMHTPRDSSPNDRDVPTSGTNVKETQ